MIIAQTPVSSRAAPLAACLPAPLTGLAACANLEAVGREGYWLPDIYKYGKADLLAKEVYTNICALPLAAANQRLDAAFLCSTDSIYFPGKLYGDAELPFGSGLDTGQLPLYLISKHVSQSLFKLLLARKQSGSADDSDCLSFSVCFGFCRPETMAATYPGCHNRSFLDKLSCPRLFMADHFGKQRTAELFVDPAGVG